MSTEHETPKGHVAALTASAGEDCTPQFIQAVVDGNVKQAEQLLDRGANIEFRVPAIEYSYEAHYLKACREHSDHQLRDDSSPLSRTELEKKISLDKRHEKGERSKIFYDISAIGIAAIQNDPDMVKMLLAQGAEPNPEFTFSTHPRSAWHQYVPKSFKKATLTEVIDHLKVEGTDHGWDICHDPYSEEDHE